MHSFDTLTIELYVRIIFDSTETNNIYLTLTQFNNSPQSTRLPRHMLIIRYGRHKSRGFLLFMLDLMAFMCLAYILANSINAYVCVCDFLFNYFPICFLITRNNHWQPKRNETICKTTCAVVRTLLKNLFNAKKGKKLLRQRKTAKKFRASSVFDIFLFCIFSTKFVMSSLMVIVYSISNSAPNRVKIMYNNQAAGAEQNFYSCNDPF